MKIRLIHAWLAATMLTGGQLLHASTITPGDPVAGGIGYGTAITAGATDSGTFSTHVGAWSWEDNSLFDSDAGEPPVGWTHTSHWVMITLQEDTVLTVTMARDAAVPWNGVGNLGGYADVSSMYPSLTLWSGSDNDGDDFHTYNNRGNVDWAEDLAYIAHADNSTETSISRSWALPAGTYTIACGSNAASNNALRQGFSFSFSTAKVAKADPVPNLYPESAPASGGVGYGYTIIAGNGSTGTFSDHVGAWSWEDNSLFNAATGEQPVGWTHTSKWVAVKLTSESLFTVTMARDAAVPWTGTGNLGGFADTSSMFPSLTLWRGWDNDNSDHHTYNNRGRVPWAEDLSYVDHVDNSTQDTISRTWRLPAGEYSFAIGSNAPANNTLRQGFSFTYSASGVAPITNSDPAAGGIGYAHTIVAGQGDSGQLSDHVGAWSWEDNSLFDADAGDPPVGWTHTSRWVALHLKDSCTFSVTMTRDATVPWVSGSNPNPNQLADTSSMYPSLTLWRGWDNDGSDHHTYNNRGNVDWAEDLSYIDHVDNSTQTTITRSWTLPAGNYSFALGSNAASNNTLRQGFKFSYATSASVFIAPTITQQPVKASLLAGAKATFNVKATGPSLVYEWRKNGKAIDGAINMKYEIPSVSNSDAGDYTVVVRNAAGAVISNVATLEVTTKPDVDSFTLPDLMVGEVFPTLTLTATNNPVRFNLIGKLPVGMAFDAKTGKLSGRPLFTGTYKLGFTATNKAGTGAKQEDTFVVSALTTGLAGTFTGAIDRVPSLNEYLGGRITITVSASGGLSGSLLLGSKTLPFTGTLTNGLAITAPTGTAIVNRPGKTSIALNFTIAPGARSLIGNLTEGPNNITFTARQPTAAPAPYAGNYTFAMLLDAADKGKPDVPQGHSFGALKIAANGLASGSITLADKNVITFSAPVEAGGNLTLFKLLYANSGSLLAVFNINTADSSNLADSMVSWWKMPEAATSKSLSYKSGFGPLTLQTLGRKYVIPATGIALNVAANAAGNAKISFAEGGAPDPVTRINAASVVLLAGSPKVATVLAPNPGIVTLTTTPGTTSGGGVFTLGTTGTFKGSFQLIDADPTLTSSKPLVRKADFQGVIADDGIAPKGYGFFLLSELPGNGPPKTTLATSKVLSGSVLLEAK